MTEEKEPIWLVWARELQAIGQAGLTYCKNEYDIERFHQIVAMSAKMMARGSGETIEKIEGLFAKEVGYQTPKTDVRAAIFKDGKILLVQEKADENKWTLPGGWCDVNNTPSQNAEKEVREETGLEVRATKIAAVYDRTKQGHTPEPHYSYKLFFICTILGGELKTSFETGESRFFAENEVPQETELSVRRVRRSQILHMFDHFKNPELPTYFD